MGRESEGLRCGGQEIGSVSGREDGCGRCSPVAWGGEGECNMGGGRTRSGARARKGREVRVRDSDGNCGKGSGYRRGNGGRGEGSDPESLGGGWRKRSPSGGKYGAGRGGSVGGGGRAYLGARCKRWGEGVGVREGRDAE